MNILLVSSTMESLSSAKLFKRLKDSTLHKASSIESLSNTNITLDLVFFDAALGLDDITQQIQLYQQKNQCTK